MTTRSSDVWAEWTAPAELDSELAECIIEMQIGPMIKHKYVNDIYVPQMNARYNKQLAYKREAVEKTHTEQAWGTFIMLHERPWRFEALTEVADEMDDGVFWDAVRLVWMDSENIRQHQDEWDELLRSDRPGRENMMDDEEREALAVLPEMVEIYQGHTDERDDGWSWTTDRDKALWFARRFASMEGAEPELSTAMVHRDDIAAYLLGRGEHEVLVDPDLVALVQVDMVEREP
jgi:hypothetical protein